MQSTTLQPESTRSLDAAPPSALSPDLQPPICPGRQRPRAVAVAMATFEGLRARPVGRPARCKTVPAPALDHLRAASLHAPALSSLDGMAGMEMGSREGRRARGGGCCACFVASALYNRRAPCPSHNMSSPLPPAKSPEQVISRAATVAHSRPSLLATLHRALQAARTRA